MEYGLERRLNTAPLPRNLVSNLYKAGFDLASIATDMGMNPGYIESGLTMFEADALLTKAWDIIADPAICLKVGMIVDAKLYNSSPLYALIAPTLDIAYERHAQFSPLVAGFPMSVATDGRIAELKIDSRAFESRPYCFAKIDYHFTSMLGFTHLTTEKDIYPLFIKLRHPKPDFAELYLEKFKCPVSFSEEENVMALSHEDYITPQLTHNPVMEPFFAAAVDQLMRDLKDDSIHGRVRRVLEASPSLREVSLASLAKLLIVSERTLQRRLAEEETTFADLLDDVRREAAMRALTFKDANTGSLSYQLGFSDVNSFYRAFKRWTGQTVDAFRRLPQG